MSKWEELGEFSEIRKMGPGRFHFIEIITPYDYDGDEIIVTLSEVDLYQAGPELVKSALEAVDLGEPPEEEMSLAQVLCDCGYRAPMGTWSGTKEKFLIAKAKKESNRLRNHEYHEERMMAPANQIGSTAREFMIGNLNRALICSMTDGSPIGEIMAKAHGYRTEEAVASLRPYAHGPTRSVVLTFNYGVMQREGLRDPLPLSMGLLHALSGQGLPLADRKKKAPAYIKGFQLGTDVAAGRMPLPDWAKPTT